MDSIDRRVFLAAAGTAAMSGATGKTVDDTLRTGIERRKIPAVAAMFASGSKTLYSGAFGEAKIDSIFAIASMTKAVTTVAALQLVEQGKVALDEPVARHLAQFKDVQVVEGDSLRPAASPVTLRQLLTHTSGLCYDMWDADAFRYSERKLPRNDSKAGPLMFDPGKRWQYGQGIDWAGRLVEAISGMTLEEYFQRHILQPLGMHDTSYILPASKFDRLVTNYRRGPDGRLQAQERKLPTPPKSFNGGGGLYSTAADYTRFLQMILNGGLRILQPKSIEMMKVNQIGPLTAGKMKTQRPELTSDVDIQPGHTEKWTLGFLLNTDPYDGGRSAGSLAWAGLFNTFYWIDPKRDRCAVILMQFLPFVDKEAVGMLNDFERAVYAAKLG